MANVSKNIELLEVLSSMVVDNNKGLSLSLGELDYVYKNEENTGSRVRVFNNTTRFSFVESFLNGINHHISNICDKNILDSKKGYQFPTKTTCELYHKLFKTYDTDSFVNKNKKTTCKALNNLKNDLNIKGSKAKNYSVTGKVGSGKSTFVKYISQILERDFDEYNIIYSLIRYEDYKEKIRYENTKEYWKDEFESATLNQLLYHSFLKIDDDEESLLDELTLYSDVKLKLSNDKQLSEQISTICEILGENSLYSSWSFELIDNLCKNTKKHLLQFIIKKYNIKVLIIFDGFDAFSIDKMINKNTKSIIDYFFDVIFNKGDVLSLSPDSYSTIISLRDCTYAKLLRKLHTEDEQSNNIINWRVCPPGVKKALYRGVYSYFLSDSLPVSLCDKFIITLDKIHEKIKRTFKTTDDEVVKIFNQDYRRLKSYYILIIRQIISDLVDKKGAYNSVEDFLEYIINCPVDKLLIKHDLVELLILRDSRVFYNYFSAIDIESTNATSESSDESLIHAEPNPGKGLVDNIFGYSIIAYEDYSEIPLTLVKARILQFLEFSDEHKTISEIQQMLHRLGYLLSKPLIRNFLHILGESGFVKNRWSYDKSIIIYKETALGKYTTKELLNNGRYLEHIIQKTLIPKNITSLMMPSCKYCDDEGKYHPVNWIYSSVINLYVFSNYILFLENYEFNHKIQDTFTQEEYKEMFSIRPLLLNILNDLDAVFNSPIFKYIDVNKLIEDIKLRKKKFEIFCVSDN